MKKLIVSFVLILLTCSFVYPQVGISIDNSSPDGSAMLDVKSNNKGLLPPRMTHSEINAISSPANGLIVYCTDCGPSGTGALSMFIAGSWFRLSATNMDLNVSTIGIFSITSSTAMVGGNVTSESGPTVTARGVCWGTTPNPTTANSITLEGTGTGSFTTNLTGLTENTTYYLRAYATSGVGTTYGNELVLPLNISGSNNGKNPVTELQLDNKKVTRIATKGSVIADNYADSTLVTIGYLNGSFNGKRPVTRPGLSGITGVNFNSSSLADFSNKVFFPTRSPYFNYFRFNDILTLGQFSFQEPDPLTQTITDQIGSITVPYATWSPLANFTFKYDITQQDPTAISKVELFNGGALLASNVGNVTTGSFTIPKSIFYTSLRVTATDVSGNEINLVLNTTFVTPLGVQISSVRLSTSSGGSALNTSEGAGSAATPWLIERTGSDLNYYLNWTMTKNNDANVTNINFTGTPTLSNLAGASLAQQTKSPVVLPNSDAATVYRLGVSAKGDVAQVFSSVSYSAYYQLRDKLYCGFLPANAKPTESQILALQKGSLNTVEYYSTRINPVSPDASETGVYLTNTTGGSGYFAWAVPTYSNGAIPPTFDRFTYAFAFGSWNPYDEGFDRTSYFVKTTGANATWYWVCIYNASIYNGSQIRALLQN